MESSIHFHRARRISLAEYECFIATFIFQPVQYVWIRRWKVVDFPRRILFALASRNSDWWLHGFHNFQSFWGLLSPVTLTHVFDMGGSTTIQKNIVNEFDLIKKHERTMNRWE